MHCRLLSEGFGDAFSRCAGQEAWSEEALGLRSFIEASGAGRVDCAASFLFHSEVLRF